MTRYNKINYIIGGFLTSKHFSCHVNIIPVIQSVKVISGHYQFNQLYAEHGLIFSEIFGQIPVLSTHVHGKRKKITVSLSSNLVLNNAWDFLDKFINVTLPSLEDFRTPKLNKALIKQSSYTWCFRKYFDYQSLNSFISDRLVSKHDIFLPSSLQLTITNEHPHFMNETYFRMMRLPFLFYRFNKPSAVDDGV